MGKILQLSASDSHSVGRGYALQYGSRQEGGEFFAFIKGSGDGSWEGVTDKRHYEYRKWYHVVGVYDGNIMRLYINGKEVASKIPDTPGVSYANIKALHLGKEWNRYWGDTNFFNGII